MTNTESLKVVKVEDHEGDGECRACGRTGLRWIVTLSDGSQIGTECAKKILGIKVTPKAHEWTSAFVAVAQKTYFQYEVVLWQSKATGKAGRITFNGNLQAVGGFEAMTKEFEAMTR